MCWEQAVEESVGPLKVIRLAYRSQLGWVLVNEYGEHELAGDLEEMKKELLECDWNLLVF